MQSSRNTELYEKFPNKAVFEPTVAFSAYTCLRTSFSKTFIQFLVVHNILFIIF